MRKSLVRGNTASAVPHLPGPLRGQPPLREQRRARQRAHAARARRLGARRVAGRQQRRLQLVVAVDAPHRLHGRARVAPSVPVVACTKQGRTREVVFLCVWVWIECSDFLATTCTQHTAALPDVLVVNCTSAGRPARAVFCRPPSLVPAADFQRCQRHLPQRVRHPAAQRRRQRLARQRRGRPRRGAVLGRARHEGHVCRRRQVGYEAGHVLWRVAQELVFEFGLAGSEK